MQAYPNPAAASFRAVLERGGEGGGGARLATPGDLVVFILHDSFGNEVDRKESLSGEAHFQTHQRPPGLYLLRATDAQETVALTRYVIIR
ncbi:MAG: hypothetical protein WBA12_00055 [Catalinimonas sp.]